MVQFTNSQLLHEEALKHIVGGVNSPSRTYKAVGGGTPVVMERAQGAYFWDVDGNQFIDYLAGLRTNYYRSCPPTYHRSNHPCCWSGVLYGTPTPHEVKFAKMLKEAIPSMDKVRFVNSGTEAVMTTIRVARAYTRRD